MKVRILMAGHQEIQPLFIYLLIHLLCVYMYVSIWCILTSLWGVCVGGGTLGNLIPNPYFLDNESLTEPRTSDHQALDILLSPSPQHCCYRTGVTRFCLYEGLYAWTVSTLYPELSLRTSNIIFNDIMTQSLFYQAKSIRKVIYELPQLLL